MQAGENLADLAMGFGIEECAVPGPTDEQTQFGLIMNSVRRSRQIQGRADLPAGSEKFFPGAPPALVDMFFTWRATSSHSSSCKSARFTQAVAQTETRWYWPGV